MLILPADAPKGLRRGRKPFGDLLRVVPASSHGLSRVERQRIDLFSEPVQV